LQGVTHDVIILHDIKLMRDFTKGLENGRLSVRERKREIVSVREWERKLILKVTY